MAEPVTDETAFDEPTLETPAEPAPVADPVAPAPSVTPVKPTHSPRIAKLAVELGISPDDIEAATPDQLEEEVAFQTRLRLQQAKVTSPEPKEEDVALEFGLDENGQPYNGEEVHPAIRNAIKAATKSLVAKTKELEKALKTTEDREKAREVSARTERIDRAFEKLNNEAMFGAGSVGDHAEGSPERARREAVYATAAAMKSGTVEQRIAKAAALLFGEAPEKAADLEPKKAAYDPLEERKKAWDQAGVKRPVQRTGAPEPKGIEKAKKTFIREMERMGQGDGLVEEVTASLPD